MIKKACCIMKLTSSAFDRLPRGRLSSPYLGQVSLFTYFFSSKIVYKLLQALFLFQVRMPSRALAQLVYFWPFSRRPTSAWVLFSATVDSIDLLLRLRYQRGLYGEVFLSRCLMLLVRLGLFLRREGRRGRRGVGFASKTPSCAAILMPNY